jgi:gamma-glutamylaminecyclotransferase
VSAAGSHCYLFAYGSLKRGGSNQHELGTARFVAQVTTAPRYALRLLLGYPLLVPGALAIRGELFELPQAQLLALDAFEGAAYERCEIELADGSRVVAYMSREPGAGVPYPADEWPVTGAG